MQTQNYTIEVSGPIYHQLNQQASNQNSSMDCVLERLLVLAPLIWPEANNTSVEEALAAVQRVTTVFADSKLENIDDVLNEPMIELANSDLGIEFL